MQDRHMAFRLLRIVCFMRPCVNLWCFRMAYKLEYLNNPFPHGLSLKHLFHGDTFYVASVHPM